MRHIEPSPCQQSKGCFSHSGQVEDQALSIITWCVQRMNSSSIQHHCTKRHIICLIVFDLSFVSIQPIVTDADKDVLDTRLDKTDYMEIDYNSVHITVNEQAAPSNNRIETQSGPFRSYRI
jgi:hypothetical protein